MHKEHSLWLYIIVMSSLVMVGVFAMDAFMPALGAIAHDFSVSEAVAEQTVGSYFLGYAVFSLIIAPMADSIGRKKVILINNLIFLLATIACIMSPNISFLIIMRFIQGASGGAMWTAGRIITVEMFPEAKAKQAFGILSVIFSFGPAIAPIIGGWMVADFSWAGSFYVMIVISIFASILAILYLPETLTAEKQQRINILNTVKNYGFLLNNKLALAVLCAIMLFTTANYIYISASHKFLIDLLGLKPTDFAYLYWPLMIGNVLAGFVNAKFAYRMNSSKVMRIAIMVMSIATISNIILCYSHIQQILLLVIPLAVYTFGVAIILPVLMVELMKVSGNLRGLASALFSVGIFMANSIIASFILPLVWTSTLSLAIFQFVLLLCGVTVMILFFKQKAFINYVEVTK